MDAESISILRDRPTGTSSRLRRAEGVPRHCWKVGTLSIELPLVVDHVHLNPDDRSVRWWVDAIVDLVDGSPALVELVLRAPQGADLAFLQREFRWASPVDIVQRTVPQLLEKGLDPFEFDFATEGYPAAADLGRRRSRVLSDAFLEEIATEYLEVGRGYAQDIALRKGVTPRTVVSWIEKARARGILSSEGRGRQGGTLVPRSSRLKS